MERSRIENRSDDNLEVIKTRLDKYFAETQPLATMFKEKFKDKFFEINATQEITKIQYDIENKLKNAQIQAKIPLSELDFHININVFTLIHFFNGQKLAWPEFQV